MKSRDIEFSVIHKDGHSVYMHSRPTIIKHKGIVTGFNAIIQDITSRKDAEVLLKESEERYRMIFENASDEIILLNQHGKIIDVNPISKEILIAMLCACLSIVVSYGLTRILSLMHTSDFLSKVTSITVFISCYTILILRFCLSERDKVFINLIKDKLRSKVFYE